MPTKIQWTHAPGYKGEVWNPVTGCSHVSPGCENCYAERLSHRFGRTTLPWGAQHAAQNVQLHPDKLTQPVHWRAPRLIFVNSVSDLFHELVPDSFLLSVWLAMSMCPEHRFLVLTKRPERMQRFVTGLQHLPGDHSLFVPAMWPVPNVWLGVSTEDQRRADERIPILLQTPAAVRFVSAEPLLGPVDLSIYLATGWDEPPFDDLLNWVIVGGESGNGARPMDLAWARGIVQQCAAAEVPVFVKQLGAKPVTHPPHYPEGQDLLLLLNDGKGGDPDEWPEDLRIRQWPAGALAAPTVAP